MAIQHFTDEQRKNCLLYACAVTGLGLAAVSATANGFDQPNQDAFAIGRGLAFVATADNPSAIYYNPAGISQLEGQNVRAGVYGSYTTRSFEPPSRGGSWENKRPADVGPQFYYTLSLPDVPLSFGLGFYSPFRLSSRWPEGTGIEGYWENGFRRIATEASLTYYTIAPVVAWRITTNLSIAAGVTVNYADLDWEHGLYWPDLNYDNFKFKGNGWGIGYNVGALWKVGEKVCIGLAFRSSTDVGLDGYTESYNNMAYQDYAPFPTQHIAANAELTTPPEVVGGISYRPTPKWNIEFDAEYVIWNAMEDITVHQQRPYTLRGPLDVSLRLQAESSWNFSLGATHYFKDRWYASAGYRFNQNSVPDRSYNPSVVDLDRHFLSVGAGYKLRNYTFDLAYQFGYGPTRTVFGSPYDGAGWPPQTANGRYDYLSHLLAASVGIRF